MTFVPKSGRWSNVKMPTKASVTYTAGMFLYNDGTDNVITVAAAQLNMLGIANEAKDNDANTTSISVRVPQSIGCTFLGDMVSGETLSKGNEGDVFDFAAGGLTISTTSTYDVVQLVRYVSTTQGIFRLNQTTGIEN